VANRSDVFVVGAAQSPHTTLGQCGPKGVKPVDQYSISANRQVVHEALQRVLWARSC
jgi:hypothetical protein